MNDQKFVIKSKSLFPIHVGGGNDLLLDSLSYTVKTGWFYHINLDKMLSYFPKFAKEFINLSEKGDSIIELRDLIANSFDDSKRDCWYFRAKVSEELEALFKGKIGNLQNQLLVQCMMHSNNRAIIPGSSIKGAIRTAILNERINDGKNGQLKEKIVDHIYNLREKDKAVYVEGQILMRDKFDIKKDPFRGLKISDAILPEDSTEIVLVYNIKRNSDEKGIPMFVEVVQRDINFHFEMIVMDKEKLPKEIQPYHISDEEVRNSCYEFYMNTFYDEIENFDYEENSRISKRYVEDFQKLCNEEMKYNDSSTLIRIGRFSHVESMTYSGELFQTNYKNGYGKTRNLINGEIPMGVMYCEFKK